MMVVGTPEATVCQVAVVELVATNACPLLGAVAAETETVVVALLMPSAAVAWPAVRLAAVPVMFVPTNDDGVPSAGVTSVGLVANTAEPVPVSSLSAARRAALVRLPVVLGRLSSERVANPPSVFVTMYSPALAVVAGSTTVIAIPATDCAADRAPSVPVTVITPLEVLTHVHCAFRLIAVRKV